MWEGGSGFFNGFGEVGRVKRVVSIMDVVSSRAAIVGIIIALCSGCASLGVSKTPEEQVQARAQARLDALMRRDFEGVFSYLAPGLRETTTWQRYGSKYAGVVNWREAKVVDVTCEPERCDARTSISYRMVRPRIENTRIVDEVWIEVRGEWYIYEK